MSSATEIEIDGQQVPLTNLDKVFYPASGFTKGQVVDYYMRVGPLILPHLENRLVSFKRYPNGVDGRFFWEKQCPPRRPRWVRTAAVWSQTHQRDLRFCLLENLPSLAWAVNRAALELHVSLARASEQQRPTAVVFDLDPGAPVTIVQCAQVGLWLRELFERQGLQSFPKVSGSKGLQIYVPLNTPTTYEKTKPFAHALAIGLERQHPELIVSNMKRSLRPGKVLVDWSQNDDYKTTVCVYSLRALTRPTVSTPVSWDEVATLVDRQDPELLIFEAAAVLARVERLGDLFAPVLNLKQRLPDLSPEAPL